MKPFAPVVALATLAMNFAAPAADAHEPCAPAEQKIEHEHGHEHEHEAEEDTPCRVVVIVEAEEEEELGPRRKRKRKDRLNAIEGEDPPPGYVYRERPHRALLATGIPILGGGYLFGAMTSLFDGLFSHGESPWTGWIPVVGPFIASADDSGARGFYIVSGVLQHVGLALTIAGASTKQKAWIRRDVADNTPTAPSVRVKATPGGIGLEGSF